MFVLIDLYILQKFWNKLFLFELDYSRENYEDDFEKGKTVVVAIATLLVYQVSMDTP